MTRSRLAALLVLTYVVLTLAAIPLIPILSAWVYGDLLPRLFAAVAR